MEGRRDLAQRTCVVARETSENYVQFSLEVIRYGSAPALLRQGVTKLCDGVPKQDNASILSIKSSRIYLWPF